ncbi:ferritin family protein [archaeon]
MDTVEALKSDLGKELAVIDLYKQYVEQINDQTTRQIFMQLINESMEHANSFRRLLLKKTMGVETQDKGLNDIALGNLLEIGMKEERGVRKIYEEQLAFIEDPEYAELLTKIIEDEKRHEQMLKDAFDRLKG